MPMMNEWDKSKKLTNDLRQDIIGASINFCFKPLSEIFEELYIVLAWELYQAQTPVDIRNLYAENKDLMSHLVSESTSIVMEHMSALPSFQSRGYNQYSNQIPEFPIPLPVLNKKCNRYGQHNLQEPPEGTNKTERALYNRYIQLKKDITIFRDKVAVFQIELSTALNSCTTTKQFCEQNPEFEGYMKQSLKKFYSDKHPNVITSLNSAMNVRTYASLMSGHRLQAYQVSMLAQLEQLESRHTVQVSPQA